jgi:hypothetical protein
MGNLKRTAHGAGELGRPLAIDQDVDFLDLPAPLASKQAVADIAAHHKGLDAGTTGLHLDGPKGPHPLG